MSDTPNGAALLTAWLDSGRMNRTAFADACGVSRQTVYKWQAGEVRLSMKQQHRIEYLTGGTVPVTDWLTAAERVEVTR